MPVWPMLLPGPVRDGYLVTPVDAVLRSPMDAGPPKVRRKQAWAGPEVRGTWVLSAIECDQFFDWYEREVRHGAVPFAWYEPLRGRPGSYMFQRPPRVSLAGPQMRTVQLELVCLEEWWPGVLSGAGRTVLVWDPRSTAHVRMDRYGFYHTSSGNPVGRWIDRMVGAALVAPEDTCRPTLLRDAENPLHLWTDGDDRLEVVGFQLDLGAFGIALACSLDPSSALYSRVLSFLPATGNDWDRSDALIVTSYDHTDIAVLGAGYSLAYDTDAALARIGVTAIGTGQTSALRVNGVQRAVQSGLSIAGQTAGGLVLAAGMSGGSIANYGKRRYFGLAVVSGYAPSGAEVIMLDRWAMAMAGQDPMA